MILFMAVVIQSVAVLFILIALGFCIGKKKMFGNESISQLSDFLVKVALPVTVFNSMQMDYDPELVAGGIEIFFITIGFHLASLLLGFGAARLFHIESAQKGVWLFVCMFSNNGFMGFPLALAIFGNEGMFFMSIANVVSNFLIFSLGVYLLTMGHEIKERPGLKKMVLNNINIAVVLGLICYISQIPLPGILTQALDYIGSITAGLSMIVVGLSLSKMNAAKMFSGKNVYLLSAMRLIVIPALVTVICRLIPGNGQNVMPGVIVLMAALPSPSSVTIISEQYHIETQLGAKIVFLSTLFCLVTVPFFMVLAV